MSRVAVIGARPAVEGYRLAGALVRIADDPNAVRDAVATLPDDVAVLILTRDAAAALPADHDASDWPLRAVLP
ncbi:MAG TPA: V-type ATP synthase subunit F [Micromonosporaceae bacterium]|jgi:vacuolar-type H+-ATPase subunit F/Vma7|nr:V-type ATP synthase subunit F [Micromonosporaceae bacterium]